MCHLDRPEDKMRRVFPGVDRQACGRCSFQIDQVIGVMESIGVGFQLELETKGIRAVDTETGEVIAGAPKTTTQRSPRGPRKPAGIDGDGPPPSEPSTE